MVHTNIQIETDIKVIGTTIFKMGLEHIIILMVIYTKENGLMENHMEKEIIFIMETKEYIREIGKMGKKKVSDNW